MVLSFLESIWMWCKALNIGNRAPSPGHLCVLTMECVKDWHRSAKYSTLAGLLLQNVHVINWNAVWAHTYTYSYFTHGPKWVVEIFYACMHIHTETDTHTHTTWESTAGLSRACSYSTFSLVAICVQNILLYNNFAFYLVLSLFIHFATRFQGPTNHLRTLYLFSSCNHLNCFKTFYHEHIAAILILWLK